MNNIKALIFDFDGVIAESVQVKTDAFAALYASYGNDVIQKVVDYHEANGGISRFEKIKYYHKTFLNINLTENEIKELADRFSKLVINKVIESPYVPGSLEYIQNNYKKYKVFISTGTPTEEINQILIGRRIAHFFTGVYGSPEKKEQHIQKIITDYKLDPSTLLFFGDSLTDFLAAKTKGVKFVLRRHKSNTEHFDNYSGTAIINFSKFDEQKLKM